MRKNSIIAVLLVLVLWLAGLGAAAQFAKFAVPFSYVRAQYPDAGTEIGWLLTLISALGAILGMTAGVFVARVGFGKTVVMALVIGGVLSLWQASLPGLVPMLISRFVEGLSHLMMVVAAPTLIAQIASDRYRGMSMTLWSTFFGVSFALVAWLGLPYLEENGLGALLAAHGLYMLVLSVIVGLALYGTKRTKTLVTEPLGFRSVLRKHVAAYSSPNVAAPALGWLFYTLTFVSLLAVLPDLLSDESRDAVIASMPLVSIAVSLIFVSLLLTRFSAVAITAGGFVLSAGVVLLYFVGAPLPFICIALFAALGLVQGASFAAVPELNTTGEARALANGAMAQMGNVGNLLGTPILLMILYLAGPSAMLIVVIALYLAGAVAHTAMARARRQNTAPRDRA